MLVLTDQWAKFESAVKAANILGSQPSPKNRRPVEAIIWCSENGAKWKVFRTDLRIRYTVYLSLRRLAVLSVWHKIVAHLVALAKPQLAFAYINPMIARAYYLCVSYSSGPALPRRAGCHGNTWHG